MRARGNIDKKKNFKNIILENPSTVESSCYYSGTIEDLHFIAMDSHTPDSNMGCFGETQLKWLETELEEHQNEPIIIGFHHPIFFFGAYGLFNKSDALKFREIISKYNVLAVLNGHLHMPLYTIIDGVQYIQAGSPLWENSIKGSLSHNSSSFNVLSYHEGHLLTKPVSFSDQTQFLERAS